MASARSWTCAGSDTNIEVLDCGWKSPVRPICQYALGVDCRDGKCEKAHHITTGNIVAHVINPSGKVATPAAWPPMHNAACLREIVRGDAAAIDIHPQVGDSCQFYICCAITSGCH